MIQHLHVHRRGSIDCNRRKEEVHQVTEQSIGIAPAEAWKGHVSSSAQWKRTMSLYVSTWTMWLTNVKKGIFSSLEECYKFNMQVWNDFNRSSIQITLLTWWILTMSLFWPSLKYRLILEIGTSLLYKKLIEGNVVNVITGTVIFFWYQFLGAAEVQHFLNGTTVLFPFI